MPKFDFGSGGAAVSVAKVISGVLWILVKA
jgi:hypothetical protein